VVGSIRKAVAIAALACGALQGVGFADPSHRYRNTASVCIHLTIADQLSGAALNTVKEEASRIWIRQGIALTWTGPAAETCRAVVPIIFDASELLTQGGRSSADALGLTVFLGRAQTIYVSAPRAFKMLGQTSAFDQAVATQGERDYRGGLLIGRVVAHELGHVLLTTTAHSQTGLMRPVFGLRDVLSTDSATTDLSPIETNRLAMRFSLIPLDSPSNERSVLARSDLAKR